MDCETIRANVRNAFWVLQVTDRKGYNRLHKKTWLWLKTKMSHKDFDRVPIFKFIINSHLAAIDMGLLRGFGLAKGTKTKGRTKAAGAPYSDPERYSIYPEIRPKTTWPKEEVLSQKRKPFQRRQGAHLYQHIRTRARKGE